VSIHKVISNTLSCEVAVLFQTPTTTDEERWVIATIDELRERLRHRVMEPRRWVGLLRRVTLGRNIQGSNSIEGYTVSLDDAVAAAEGEEPADADTETWSAIRGYREAMTYVLQLADDAHFEWDGALIRSLHYMMLSYDLTKRPGRWRLGPSYVQRDADGATVYEGPDPELVPGLMGELITTLRSDGSSPVVRAAMAHLDLVMIHPFRDGNGRMARCLQTLVLAREGILSPEFSSIEEYLGRNTRAYYDVLADVGAGHWQPQRDVRPWVRFCLTAHFRQANTLLRRVNEAEARYNAIEALVKQLTLNERSVPTLFDASMGFRVRNATYRSSADVSELVASRDLRVLVERGLLEPSGEKRGRYYVRTGPLAEIDRGLRAVRAVRRQDDPFELAAQALSPAPGLSPG
jgi:Fic family protein